MDNDNNNINENVYSYNSNNYNMLIELYFPNERDECAVSVPSWASAVH